MRLFPRENRRKRERGQTLALLCIVIVVLVACVGLAIDLGLAYINKANLSKAVDAACLEGVRNLRLGDENAINIARSSFALNYGTPSNAIGSAALDVTIGMDATANKVMTVNATSNIRTFFIRVLPGLNTIAVSANARASRAKLIMTLVLDRSGSMTTNGGSTALPPAVRTFIDYFDDANDRVALSSFAAYARVDVQMPVSGSGGFNAPIKAAVSGMGFNGGTFAQGGLQFALTQNGIPTVAPGENEVRVVVFFTDGLANIVQENLNCTTMPQNIGSFDSGSSVAFLDTLNGNSLTPPVAGCSTSGGTPPCCSAVNRFTSAIDGSPKTFTRVNVTADAQFRSVQTATAMRAAGMYVYSIGLGNNVSRNFLLQIANDPASPTYDSSQPIGAAVFAPTASDLQGVFQTIASRILLRLAD